MAATHRIAKVEVHNETSGPIYAVSVVHKYSNVYKNRKEWTEIGSGQSTCDNPMTIDYDTGALTIGKDWWLIT
ncbi:hypothetical protein K7432_017061, partial [Basidiobolus ranarum]